MTHGHFNARRGFTLIELLVVIAIIGILSAVVLASLQTARNKGTDGAIKSDLAAIQTQAELYYDTNNGYATGSVTTCTAASLFTDPTIKAALMAATSSIASQTEGTGYRCVASTTAYWVATRLTTTNQYWCMDNSGQPKLEAALPATSASVCP
jgi:prepilin-type N-terminal cleavage/methylation domain-containing protein